MADEETPCFSDRIANDDGDIEVLYNPESDEAWEAMLAEARKLYGLPPQPAEPDEEDE
jgi:hypothetical protein